MKTEKRTTTTHKWVDSETIVYIADDGTEFSDMSLCIKYDNNLKRLGEIENCADLEGMPPTDADEHSENSEYFWYRPKSKAEIETLNAVYPLNCTIPDDYTNHWLCIEVSSDQTGAWFTGFDYSMEQVKTVCDALGYDVVITERTQE